jgi:hypothetical protein
MDKPEVTQRAAAPDALGIAGRAVSLPLRQALYAIAREQADEEVESADLGMWAGLIRQADAAADQIPDVVLSGDVDPSSGQFDPAELAALRASAGLIVTRDADGDIAVREFPSLEELAAAWSAILVELTPSEPGAPTVRSPESEDNPT